MANEPEKLIPPDLPSVDPLLSLSYNLLLVEKLIKMLSGFNNELVEKMYSVETSVQPESLAYEVANQLMEQKLKITIPYDIVIGAMFMVRHNDVVYRVDYVDSFEIRITNVTKPAWDVNYLIVQVKNGDGTVVNPTITCQDHIVKIYFGDTIDSTYHVYII
jgi:hypothetical protein